VGCWGDERVWQDEPTAGGIAYAFAVADVCGWVSRGVVGGEITGALRRVEIRVCFSTQLLGVHISNDYGECG
jgi:hypothetical protein